MRCTDAQNMDCLKDYKMNKCNTRVCKAGCCYNVPMPKKLISAYRKKIANPILRIESLNDDMVLAITDNDPNKNKCPFLNKEYKCNIYPQRPCVCRMFGDERFVSVSRFLRCAYLNQ